MHKIYFCLFFIASLAYLFQFSQAACPVTQVFDPVTSTCRDSCLTFYYVITQGSNQVCYSQAPVKNTLRPTIDPFTFIVIFDEVNYTIIENTADVFQVLTFSLDLGSRIEPLTASDITLSYLDADKTTLQVALAYQTWMTYPATFIIDFEYTVSDQTKSFYFKNSQLSINLLPFDLFSEKQANFVDVLQKMDFGLEIAWTSISLLNYYPIAYLYGKQYRETFNLYKLTGVNYSPIALAFYRESNGKIAGVKVPNIFSILLYDKDFNSGWDVDMNKRLLLQNDPKRDDYKIMLNRRFHEFNSSPLFLENLGIEIIIFFGILVGVIVTEILAFLFFNDEESETIFYTAFMFIRVLFRWNFLLATLIGGLPTLIYFAMAQIQAFAEYGSIGHNMIGGIVSIFVIVVFGVLFPLIVFEKIRLMFRLKEKHIEVISYDEVLTLDFYGILHEYYKTDSLIYPMFILVPLIRSIVTAPICLFLTHNPLLQVILMLIMSVVIFIGLLKFRPYSKKHYNVLHIGLETINLLMLIIMIVLASTSEDDLLDSGFVGFVNIVMMLLWTFTPLWVTGFGVYVIAIKFRKNKVQKPPTTMRQRKISVRMSMRASVRVHPLKVGVNPRIQLEKRPEQGRQRVFDAFKFEQNSLLTHKNTLDSLSPGRSPTRSPSRWPTESPSQASLKSFVNSPERSERSHIKSRTQIVPDTSKSSSPTLSGSQSRIMIRSNTNIPKDPSETIEQKLQSKLPPGIPIQLAAIKAAETENLDTKKEDEEEQVFDIGLNSNRNLLTLTKM